MSNLEDDDFSAPDVNLGGRQNPCSTSEPS
jgi:hypothetical protein